MESPSARIDERIKHLGDWRGETLAQARQLIHEADPEIQEEWKWVKPTNPGTPVWSHDGIVCTGESYKEVVKLTFARGASLEDPKKLFNSSLEGNARRAIDIAKARRSRAIRRRKRRLSNSSARRWRQIRQRSLLGRPGKPQVRNGRRQRARQRSRRPGYYASGVPHSSHLR